MADLAPEVKVVVTAEDQGVSAAISNLASELRNLKTQEEATARSSLNLASTFRHIVEAVGAYRLLKFGEDVMENAVAVGNLSRTIGVSASTISVFRHVSEETGVSWERIARSLAMGARRITEFQGGVQQAAQGMKLLGLTEKDFVGLNADQKLQLMIQTLGRMPDGFNKAAAAQMLFSRGGKDIIVVANAIARQGFGRIEEDLKSMGALMDDTFVTQAAIAKASLHDTSDVAEGLAIKFETGLLPAISDTGAGILKWTAATGQGTDGMVLLGQYGGVAVKGLIVGFHEMWGVVKDGVYIVELLGGVIVDTVETVGLGIAGVYHALTSQFTEALEDFKKVGSEWKRDIGKFESQMAENDRSSRELVKDLFPDAEKAKSFHDALLGTPEGNAERMKEAAHRLALDQKTAGAEEVPNLLSGGQKGPLEAAQKAELALALKHQQDLLEIYKATAAQEEEIQKNEYDHGVMSIAQYYADRRKAIAENAAQEIAVLQTERAQLVAAADLAGTRAFEAKGNLNSASNLQERQHAAEVLDKLNAEQFEDLARIDEIDAKIATTQIASKTALTKLDDEQSKNEIEGKQKILEFLQQIDALQGKSSEKALAQSDARVAEMRQLLNQFKGQSIGGVTLDSAGIEELVKKYKDLKLAAASFQDTQKDISLAMKQMRLDIDAVKANPNLSEAAKERDYANILKQEGPLLEKKAQEELAAARATGDPGLIQQATETLGEIKRLENEVEQLAHKWRETFAVSMTTSMKQFMQTATSTTGGVGKAFGDMEMTVIHALESTAAQMIANALVSKAIDTDTKLSSAEVAAANTYKWVSNIPVVGWILAPAAAAAAFATVLAFKEGGSVEGPKGIDAVPAMLTAGEFVVNADAAKGFGLENLHAINAGDFGNLASPVSIASPHDFSAPRFEPGEISGASHTTSIHQEITLQHNGPDALEVMRSQLVPEINKALRRGQLNLASSS